MIAQRMTTNGQPVNWIFLPRAFPARPFLQMRKHICRNTAEKPDVRVKRNKTETPKIAI